MKILLVEDDQIIADLVQNALSEQNYLVDVATDGQMGLHLADLFDYDLMLLDLNLPDLNGIDLCENLRKKENPIPIIVITADDSNQQKVLTLDAGADDYLVKPFDIEELLARIRALMRRERALNPFVEYQGLRLDLKNSEFSYYGQPLSLTKIEYGILELFLHHRKRIFSQNYLIDHLWSYDEMLTESQIKAHIDNIHLKLRQLGSEHNLIETVYGLGYHLHGEKEKPQDNASHLTGITSNHYQTPAGLKITAIFQHYRQHYRQKIEVLEMAVQALKNHDLDESLREQSLRNAHNLTGSLGLFGFKVASDKCRQMEKILQSKEELDPVMIHYLDKLVIWLKQEIESQTQPPLITKTSSFIDRSSHTPCILIVDDDIPLTQVLASEALSWGLESIVVHNLTEARKIISKTPLDVVVLDLCFPDSQENGLDLLTELAHTNPSIPVLVITVEESLDKRLQVAQLGGQAFLQKPVTAEQVMEAISGLLNHSTTCMGKIMVVDDDEEILEFSRHFLEPWGLSLTLVNNSLKFWDSLEQTNPDLLILDVEMSGFSGIDLCRIVRNDPKWSELPILMLSENKDADIISQLFTIGADDYVSKPLIGPELISRILNRLERSQMRRRWAEIDSLTGLKNRRKSLQDMTHLLKLAKRQQQSMCFVLLDLDYFKGINDRYGHDLGDLVLRQFGKFLKECFREEDVIGRWGGEEFTLALYGTNKNQGLSRLKLVLEEWRKKEFRDHKNRNFYVTFSAGISSFPEDGTEIPALYRVSDQALYYAKHQGRNQVRG